MQFDARLGGEAAALARDHAEVLRRLPATVHAFILVEMQKWPTLFPAERRYQRALARASVGRRRRRPGAAFCRDCQGRRRGGPEQDRRARSGSFSGSRPGGAAQAEPRARVAAGSRSVLPADRSAAGVAAVSARFAAPSRRPAVQRRHRGAAREAVVPVQGAGHADPSHARRREEPRWLSARALRRRIRGSQRIAVRAAAG